MIDKEKLDQKHKEAPPDYYEKGIKENFFQKIWHKRRFKEVLKLVPQRKVKYLDIGCNGGLLMDRVAKKFERAEVFGIDVSEESIDYCQRKYPDYHFKIADCVSLPFKDNYFDFITCFEVLEHMIEPKKAIQEMKRCLKQGGELLILVPTESLLFRFIWFLWTRLGRGRVWHETHINQIKSSELESVLESLGFEILKVKKSHLNMLKAVRAKAGEG